MWRRHKVSFVQPAVEKPKSLHLLSSGTKKSSKSWQSWNQTTFDFKKNKQSRKLENEELTNDAEEQQK